MGELGLSEDLLVRRIDGNESRQSATAHPPDQLEHSTFTNLQGSPTLSLLLFSIYSTIKMTADLPRTQTAAVVQNPGDNHTIVLQNDIPVPEPGPGEILIKLQCTGLW